MQYVHEGGAVAVLNYGETFGALPRTGYNEPQLQRLELMQTINEKRIA